MKFQPGDRVEWDGFDAMVVGPTDEDSTHYVIDVPLLGPQTVEEHELEPY